ARALGLAGPSLSAAVTPTLIALARDDNPDVARTALASLAKHPTPDAVEIAIGMLKSRELRGAATRALAEIRLIVVPRVSTEPTDEGTEAKVAVSLASVLGRIASPSGIKALIATLRAPHVETRLAAAYALSGMKRRGNATLPAGDVAGSFASEIAYFGQ